MDWKYVEKKKLYRIGISSSLSSGRKHASEETEHKDVPLYMDIISRDENGEGWETERRPLNTGNLE